MIDTHQQLHVIINKKSNLTKSMANFTTKLKQETSSLWNNTRVAEFINILQVIIRIFIEKSNVSVRKLRNGSM